MKQKFPYYIRLSIILIILISPILAFQIGWYFFGKKDEIKKIIDKPNIFYSYLFIITYVRQNFCNHVSPYSSH